VGIPTPATQGHRATPRRRLVAFAAVLATVPALVACGANFNAQTNIPYTPAEGVTNREGAVYALNTLVVTDGKGNGTVVSRLVNQEGDADSVQSISATTSSGDEITALPLADPIEIGAAGTGGQAVQLGTDGLLRLTGDNLAAGSFITITFNFGSAAPLEMSVPVVPHGTVYEEIPVGPVPTGVDTTG
jgi:hypothetical protein